MTNHGKLVLFVLGWAQSPPTSDRFEWREVTNCPIGSVSERAPIVAEGARGILVNEGGGLWPSGTEPLIEFVARNDTTKRYVIRATVPSGDLSFAQLPPGEYVFQAGERRGGWACHSGVLSVAGGNSTNTVRIQIPLGR